MIWPATKADGDQQIKNSSMKWVAGKRRYKRERHTLVWSIIFLLSKTNTILLTSAEETSERKGEFEVQFLIPDKWNQFL